MDNIWRSRQISQEDFISSLDPQFKINEQNTTILNIPPVSFNETYTSSIGFTKELLLSRHYACSRNTTENPAFKISIRTLENITLSAPFNEIIFQNKVMWESFLNEAYFRTFLFRQEGYHFISSREMITIQGDDTTFVLPTRWSSTNYYHWLIECMPRIGVWRYMQNAINRASSKRIIIREAHLNSFCGQWLKQIGLPDESTVIVPDNAMISIPRAHWIPILANPYCNIMLGSALNQLVASSLSPYQAAEIGFRLDSYPVNRVYISRRYPCTRSFVNESDVEDFMQSRGFRIVRLEEMSVYEQYCLFKTCSFIVGIHGAGLANIIFCQEDTAVLEIHPPTMTNPCYLDICAAMKLKYGYIIAEFCSNSLEAESRQHLVCDINILASALDSLGV